MPVEIEKIVRDVRAAHDDLRDEKGFGPLSVTTQELLIFAASIVAGGYVEEIKDGLLAAALSTSISNIIIAQHAAMIAMISATSAAAASSS
jgi:hypothetical protein